VKGMNWEKQQKKVEWDDCGEEYRHCLAPPFLVASAGVRSRMVMGHFSNLAGAFCFGGRGSPVRESGGAGKGTDGTGGGNGGEGGGESEGRGWGWL